MGTTEVDFHQRLLNAVERGQRNRDAQAQAASQQAMTAEEFKRLHSKYRLELSDHIEICLRQLVDHFPGFQLETIVDERGWGSAIVRDDVDLQRGRGRSSLYSRLETVIRPFNDYYVLDLAAKATIRNKEIFIRGHFQLLVEVNLDSFREMIDLWSLEYAEQYSAKG